MEPCKRSILRPLKLICTIYLTMSKYPKEFKTPLLKPTGRYLATIDDGEFLIKLI